MSNTEIKSDPVVIERPVEKVYQFLLDLRNYKALMPREVHVFEATSDNAKLSLSGLGSFEINKGNCITNEQIVLNPAGKLPFTFDIQWDLTQIDGKTQIIGQINAKLNVFMKMMAESKLADFVSTQALKMKDHIESGIPNV